MHSMSRLMIVAAATVLAGQMLPVTAHAGTSRARATVTCSSNDHRVQRCRVGGWHDAQLVRQFSKANCVRGRTWGLQGSVLWVSEGCRASFAEAGRRSSHGRPGVTPWRGNRSHGNSGNRWNGNRNQRREIRFSCGSPDYKYRFCTVDVGARGRVRLQRQESDTRCVLNRNWGWNRAGVWTDRGCRATFVVSRR